MATQGFVWRKCLDGGTPEIIWRNADAACKKGDALKRDATTSEVIPAAAVGDRIFGVAMADAAAADVIIPIMPARMNNIFEVQTETTAFTTNTHDQVTANIKTFTTGSMTVQCAGANKQFYTISLADGETSAEAGNKVLGFFAKNDWDGLGVTT
jgi:hypothetical protein